MALNLAVDTNRYVDFCNGVGEAIQALQSAQRLFMPFVVVAELRSGFLFGRQPRNNERMLQEFLRSLRVSVLFADEATTHFYATIYSELRASGLPVPTNDVWIAALVLQHDLVLFSRDRHFDHVPRIARI